MVEHLVCNQAVVGSNPVASTTCVRGAVPGHKNALVRIRKARSSQ